MAREYRLKDLFVSRPDEWIPLPEIWKLGIMQYNRVIKQLREADMDIENRTEQVNGEKHSWYRYNTYSVEEKR